MNHTEEKDYILSVLAQNHAGVLLRIAGLFAAATISKSIVAAQTEDNNRSRILIVVQGMTVLYGRWINN